MAAVVRPGAFCLFLLVACAKSDSDPGETKAGVTPAPMMPALDDAPTTVDRTWVPKKGHQSADTLPNPSLPDSLVDLLAKGYGDLDPGPGEPYLAQTLDDSKPPAPGPNPHRLLRFAHISDLQIADDESPTRLGNFDGPGLTSSALRPSDAYLCRMTNAAVRTINALHRKDPIAFTLTGGDNADNAQTNELEWVLGMLSGSPSVKCDSGDDTDMIPGPENDGKDAFGAEGFAMPWRWVTGNHDVLVQGNFSVAGRNEIAIGTKADGGTRNYRADKNGKIDTVPVIADPKRALLNRTDLMAKVAADKDGHGIGDAQKTSGRATYTFDVEGTPIRFLIIDTAHEDGGSEGVITQRHIDSELRALFDKARSDGKWVILASHHAAGSLSDGSGLGGKRESDALNTDAWTDFVGGYDNVIFSMVGHSHRHRVEKILPAGKHPYWEVMTAAIADWPHQFRVLEIYDQDNGWLMMRATCADFSVEGDAVAAEGKRRGTMDFTTGWFPTDDVTLKDKNVELWIKKP
jgi:3',5'-cyclic AMP phosphodiesterase CpdA